jgi:hypothetical protein
LNPELLEKKGATNRDNAVWQCVKQSQEQSKRKKDDEKLSFKKENFKVQKTECKQKRLETLCPPKLIIACEKLKQDRKKSNSPM